MCYIIIFLIYKKKWQLSLGDCSWISYHNLPFHRQAPHKCRQENKDLWGTWETIAGEDSGEEEYLEDKKA